MKQLCILFLISFNIYSQNLIRGVILTYDNKPIPEANIIISKTNIGTTSNQQGKFQIKFPFTKGLKLEISCIGYETQIIELKEYNENLIIILKEKDYVTDEVVVTATKTEKKLKELPIRTEIITRDEIKNCGFKTLKEILYEQNGLNVIDNHGSGVQVQGLDPAYTLILVDGEPVIGRTAGTLELSRLNVGNIKQIEIVKGPSSSLYGSEALAGVINLITDISDDPFKLSFNANFGTFNNHLISTELTAKYENLKGLLYVNRQGSSGYDLSPLSVSKTAPEFNNLQLSSKFEYELNNNHLLRLSLRWFKEIQGNKYDVINNSQNILINEKEHLIDFGTSLDIKSRLSKNFICDVKFYFTNYFTKNIANYGSDGQLFNYSIFDQKYYKIELSSTYFQNKNITLAGTGFIFEKVNGERLDKKATSINSHFVYFQHEWIPSRFFDIIIGARYDYHKSFSSRISPKISFTVLPYDFLKLRFSIGSGYKAPTLQQLYLDFTNPQVGYSVFGNASFQSSYEKIKNSGQVEKELIDLSGIKKINAEHSWSINTGFDLELKNNLLFTINLFRNDINNLIEAIPVAIKKSGQSIYTYFNVKEIYTQGFESELTVKLFDEFSLKAGYQYLETIDEEILKKINSGKIYKQSSSGRLIKVSRKDYGGLFNRSKHSGIIRFTYSNIKTGLYFTITGILKGRYGLYDMNNNNILDEDNEYAPGYAIWNLVINKSFGQHISLSLRIENLLDKKLKEQIINLPGRILSAGISFNY